MMIAMLLAAWALAMVVAYRARSWFGVLALLVALVVGAPLILILTVLG